MSYIHENEVLLNWTPEADSINKVKSLQYPCWYPALNNITKNVKNFIPDHVFTRINEQDFKIFVFELCQLSFEFIVPWDSFEWFKSIDEKSVSDFLFLQSTSSLFSFMSSVSTLLLVVTSSSAGPLQITLRYFLAPSGGTNP